MNRWWRKIRGWFEREGDHTPTSKSQNTTETPAPIPGGLPAVRWLEADEPGNPFKVRLLDLMVTQGFRSATADMDNAARALSWRRSVGAGLDTVGVMHRPPIECSLAFPAARVFPSGILYAPSTMEQKWVLAWRRHEGLLLAARSWTGVVEAVGVGRHEGDTLRIERLHITNASVLRFGVLPQAFEWLVRTHALKERLPFPATEEGAVSFEQSPLAAFSAFGSMIFCAATTWAPPPIRGRLYSDGEVIRAAQSGDMEALRHAVISGEGVNAPGTQGGMCALHIAAATGNQAMIDLLISLKADPCIQTARGDTVLIVGVAHRTPLAVLRAIHRITPTQLRLANSNGFSALHAAAEADYAEAIPWLLELGAELEGRTVPGHTPLHIACALGNVAAARTLLAAGADPHATSPNGTPHDVAVAEGMDRTAALFDH